MTRTLRAFFTGARDLVLLCIDTALVDAEVRWEAADGDVFPHVYGAIPPRAVVEAVPLPPVDDAITLPWEASAAARLNPRTLDELAARVLDAMTGFERPWWVAGGWAFDVWLGEVSRPHEDLDITVLRRDVDALRAHLAGWALRLPRADEPLVPLRAGDAYPADDHQIWARRDDDGAPLPSDAPAFSADPTFIDFLVERTEGETWVFRRNEAARAPLARYGGVGACRLPYVQPEIQLLYKSKPHVAGDDRNERDFARALPHLDGEARTWLRGALAIVAPGHHWIAAL